MQKNDLAEEKARRLRALDDEWREKRKKFSIAKKGDDKEIFPTPKSIAIFLAIAIPALAMFYFMVTANGLSGWLTVFPLALIVYLTYTFFVKKKSFEKEYAEHIVRRAAVEHEEIYKKSN